MSRVELTRWKFKLMGHFYSRQRALAGSEGLFSTIRQAVGGLWSKGGDSTKLQTAFRNGMISSVETFKVQFKRGWMPRRRERAFFDGWDGVYREIRARNLACGAAIEAPADTTLLHEHNVTKQIKETHGTRRRIPVAVAAHAEVG